MRLRKPKDKTAQFSRALDVLRDMQVGDRPVEQGPDVVPVEDVLPWGHIKVKNGVTPWP
jgi:hypothetical protein